MYRLWIVLCAALLTTCCAHHYSASKVSPTMERDGGAYEASPGDVPADRDARQEYFKARRLTVARLTDVRTALGTATPAAQAATPSAAVNPQQWTFIGPQPMAGTPSWSGSVLMLVMDPHNANTIYAVTFLRRLWKTTDAGVNWLPLSDFGPLISIEWLAADPELTDTLYAMDSGLLYKSTNGGSNWTELPPVVNDPSCAGEAFAVHPAIRGTWLVSEFCSGSTDTSVLYKTTNSGASWTKVATINGQIDQVAFHPNTPVFAYASGSLDTALIFETSLDTGSTWTKSIGSGSTQLPQTADLPPARVRLALAPTNPKTIFLRTETFMGSPILMVLYKTTDGGASWKQTGYPPDGQGPRTPGLTAVDPTNEDIVYAGSTALRRSVDGGATWTNIDAHNTPIAIHSDNHAMIFSPDGNTMYESNDGGVWSATNFRTGIPAWTSLNNTLGTGEFESPFAMDPTNPNRSFGGLQDNGSVKYSGVLGWQQLGISGDGNGNAINPQNPDIVYSVDDSSVHKSTTGGAPGTFVQQLPIGGNGRLIMDFNMPDTLYYKILNTLQQTQDGGNTWPLIATMPSGISDMAVAPSSSNTMVAIVGSSTPFVTNNATAGTKATFSGRLPANVAASFTGENNFVIDPTNPAKFYLLERNGGGTVPLLISSDGGMSWQARDLGPNVSDDPTDYLIDPDIPNTIYLGTESSVFRSSDGGATWWPLASGFPIVKVTSVNLHRGARILRVATAGRGAWDLSIPTTAPRVTSASVSGTTLTVNGTNFVQNSAIWLNGSALTTTIVDRKQLTAKISAGTIAPSTVYYVSVNTPGSGGGLSDPIGVSTGPTIYPNGVQNAAGPVSVTADSSANSFDVGLPPGTFAALYGSEFATSTTVATAPFPPTLGGVKVLVNGIAAPLYFVSQFQIDFVMPWGIRGTQANIQVVTSTGTSNIVTSAIQNAPQIFTTNQQGFGQGAVLIANTSFIAAPSGMFPGSRPAAKGEYISIFITGLGAVQNQPADGAPATGLSPTVAQPTVRFGCAGGDAITLCPATAQFSGLAPGFVGLYQVNVQVPANALSGSQVPLQLNLPNGPGRPSNIVTIAIQ